MRFLLLLYSTLSAFATTPLVLIYSNRTSGIREEECGTQVVRECPFEEVLHKSVESGLVNLRSVPSAKERIHEFIPL